MDRALEYQIRDDQGVIESAPTVEDLLPTWDEAVEQVGEWDGDLVLVAVLRRKK